MTNGHLRTVVRHVQRLAGSTEAEVGDAYLLQRFVTAHDEIAFELLLRRHGPMVRGVCRRLLHNPHDVEDAFQATFLALVRKAAAVTKGGTVSGWLYRVAYRAALRARTVSSRLPATNGAAEPVAPELPSDLVWRDLRPVLDAEINGLPPRYRLPVILCYFQGMTHEQAARALGCPKATVAVRLMRARKLLHTRLTRRGLALSGTAFVTALAEESAHAALSAATVDRTVRAAAEFAKGSASAASGPAVTLAEGVLRTMLLTKVKAIAAVAVLAVGVLACGIDLLPRPARVTAAPPAAEEPPARRVPAAMPERPADIVDIAAERPGRLLFLGIEIEKVDRRRDDNIVVEGVDGTVRCFRRLRAGDKVEDGQIIGQIDDDLARIDVSKKKARLVAAEADRVASEKTREEAKTRLRVLDDLQARVPGNVSPDDYRAAELCVARYTQEEIAKRAAVRAAEFDVVAAEKVLALHKVRAVRGVVESIVVRPGHAVKAGDVVVHIRVSQAKQEPVPPKEAERSTKRPPDVVDIPALRPGPILLLGIEVKDGEVVAKDRVQTVTIDGKERRFRSLRAGDRVEEGQLIGMVSDELARTDLENKKIKLRATEADRQASANTLAEAKRRVNVLREFLAKNPNAVSPEDVRTADFAVVRYTQEEVSKAAQVQLAKVDLRLAELGVRQHEIRACRGVVVEVLKHSHEAVRDGETVVQIRIDGER